MENVRTPTEVVERTASERRPSARVEKPSDRELWQQFLSHDPVESELAATVLVRRYQSLVQGYLRKKYRISAEDAEDRTQEVFIKAFGQKDRFMPNGRIASWLLRIAERTQIDWMRKSASQKALPIHSWELFFARSSEPDHRSTRKLRQWVIKKSEILTKNEAAVLNLRLNGHSNREAAGSLGISPGAASVHLSNAKRKLRDAYRKEGR